MEGFQFLSCIHFSIQLIAAETVFLISIPRKRRFWLRIACSLTLYCLCLYGVFLVATSIPGNSVLVQVCYYFVVFFLSLLLIQLCFEAKQRETLFCGVGGYTLQHMAFALTGLLRYLTGYNTETAWGAVLNSWLLYLLLPAVFYMLILRRRIGLEESHLKDLRMTILTLLILCTNIVVSLLARSPLAGPQENGFLQFFVCGIYMTLCSGMGLFLLFYIPRENRLRRDSELMEQMIRTMEDRLQISKRNVEIINRKCHDIKYQLRVLAETQDYQEQSGYIQEIRQAIQVYEGTFQTGNAALNLVLSERGPIFQEEEIQLSCLVDGTLLDFMQPLDVSALFGNALDNAIECVLQEEQREKRLIYLRVARKGQMLHIHVENFCATPRAFHQGLPVTTKPDKEYHGFGVRSIQHIVDKYDGLLSFRQQGDWFLLDIACTLQPV